MAENLNVSVTIDGKDDASPEIQRITRALVALERAAAGPQRALGQVERASQNAARQFRTAQNVVEGAAQGLGFGLPLAAGAASAAIVGFGVDSVRSFAAFDRKMRETNALLGQTGAAAEESFRSMSRQVRDFSARMGVDAVDSARALYEVISAGIPAGEEAMQVLQAGATAAIGGFTTTGTAVEGITSILNAYQRSAADATQISDEMFAVVNRGKVTFEQYSQGIGIVVPIASALGVTHAELGGIIANTTQQGVKSAEAFTALRALLGSLARPSEQAKELAAALGLEWNAEALAARGLTGVLDDLQTKTQGNKEAIGILTGDINAFNLVLANTGANAPKAAEAIAVVTQAAGDSARAQAEVNKSASRQWDLLMAKWNEAKLSFADTTASMILNSQKMRDETAKLRESQASDIEDFLAAVNQTLTDFGAPLRRALGTDPRQWEEQERALYRLNMQRNAGRISVDEYNAAVQRLMQVPQREHISRIEDELEAEGRARLEAAEAADAHTAAAQRNTRAQQANLNAALETRRQLEALYKQQAERAERELIRAPEVEAEGALSELQRAQRAVERAEQAALREQQRGLETLREGADRSSAAVDRLKNALTDANAELTRLNSISLQGTRALADRAFGIETEIAQRELQTAEEDAARAEARATGQPRPVIDRRARRQREREIAALRAQGEVVNLTDRVTLAPQRRALEQIAEPTEELPFDQLAPQLQAAQARVADFEAQIEGQEARLLGQSEAVTAAQARLRDAQLRAADAELGRQAEVDEAQQKVHEARLAVQAAEQARLDALIAEYEQKVTDAGLTLPDNAPQLPAAPPPSPTETTTAPEPAAPTAAPVVQGTGVAPSTTLNVAPGAVQLNGTTNAEWDRRLQERLADFALSMEGELRESDQAAPAGLAGTVPD